MAFCASEFGWTPQETKGLSTEELEAIIEGYIELSKRRSGTEKRVIPATEENLEKFLAKRGMKG